jgi:hypothetical protein
MKQDFDVTLIELYEHRNVFSVRAENYNQAVQKAVSGEEEAIESDFCNGHVVTICADGEQPTIPIAFKNYHLNTLSQEQMQVVYHAAWQRLSETACSNQDLLDELFALSAQSLTNEES